MTKRTSKAKPVVKTDEQIASMTDDELIVQGTGRDVPRGILNAYSPDTNFIESGGYIVPLTSDNLRVETIRDVIESPADTLTRIISELQSLSLDNSAAQGMIVAVRLLIGNALRVME